MTDDRSAADRELARLRAKAGEQELEIARLREEAAEASGELAHLGVEAQEHQRREQEHDRRERDLLGGRAPSEVVAAVTAEVQEFATTGLADDLCVLAARIGER